MLSDNNGGGNVMVWGVLVAVLEGYRSILGQHAKPSGWSLIGANFLIQQGSDPKLSSKLFREADGIRSEVDWLDTTTSQPCLWKQLECVVGKECPSSK